MKLKKSVTLLLCVLITTALLAACGGSTPTTSPPTEAAATTTSPSTEAATTTTSPPTEAAATTAATTPSTAPEATEPAPTEAQVVEAGAPTVYVVIKAMGNAYWGILQAGAIDAGKDLGVNVIITGIPDEQRIEDQITLLQNAVSARADAVLIAVADSKAEAPEVERAYDTGIPIILVDTMAETQKYTAAFVTDNYAAGEAAAKEMLRLLSEKGIPETQSGTIAVQIGSAGSQTIIDRDAGFKDYWDANAPEAWVVMWDKLQVNDGNIEKAVSIGQNVLTSEPELIAMFAPNNGSTVGFVTALAEANRTDVVMVGFDFSPEMEGLIRGGQFTVSTMLQNQYFMGYNGVAAALDIINGGSVPKDNDTGLTVVNASNVDDPEVIKAAYGGRG
ncbi:MAG: substrate-binding domain-containing protein [Oscillospiraceae bacterium]|nr:substrate-binding domain-containing protein [Oscillospiraceae bacterium]